jgi:RNA-binding protein
MTLTGKERAALRAYANRLNATVHAGQHGLTGAFMHALDDALRTRELVKVQLGKQAGLGAKDAARQIAEASQSEVIQVIGKTVTVYRHNPALERKPDGPPPWVV